VLVVFLPQKLVHQNIALFLDRHACTRRAPRRSDVPRLSEPLSRALVSRSVRSPDLSRFADCVIVPRRLDFSPTEYAAAGNNEARENETKRSRVGLK
jgi:hypothetical protein